MAGEYNVTGQTVVSQSSAVVDFTGSITTIGPSLTVLAGSIDFHELLGPSVNLPGGVVVVGNAGANLHSTSITTPSVILGATLTSGNLTVSGQFDWTGGGMRGAGTTLVSAGPLTISGSGTKFLDGRTLTSAGAVAWSGGDIAVDNGAVFNNQGTFEVTSDTNFRSSSVWYGTSNPAPAFNNSGMFRKSAGPGQTAFGNIWQDSVPFHNSGTVEVASGSLKFAGGYTQTAGSTILGGGHVVAGFVFDIQDGIVSGSGTITAAVVNAGQFVPGNSPGILNVVGSYEHTPAGGLNIEIGGNSAGTGFDQLNVVGPVSLSGSLDVNLINGFVPALNSTFTIINNDGSDPVTGTFGGLPEGSIISVGAIQFSISYLGVDGTGNDVVLKAVVVSKSAQLQADPCDPLLTALVVVGTLGGDNIVIGPVGNEGVVSVSVNGSPLGTFQPTGHIIIFGQAGHDNIQIVESIALPAIVYGNEGNDRIKGGRGDDILIGGEGDDLLVGGNGRDLLIGGIGSDRIVGNPDDDILIAGATDFDANEQALCDIMKEWTRTDADYATRVGHLRGDAGAGTALNGSILLVSEGTGATVHDDATADVLTDSAGSDWFLLNRDGDGGVVDKITDLSAQEFANDLDFISAP